ncbi:unnamed protein product, partial [marine sediment metagenome]
GRRNGLQLYFKLTNPEITGGTQIRFRFFEDFYPRMRATIYLYCQDEICNYKFWAAGNPHHGYTVIDADIWHKIEIAWDIGEEDFTKIRAKLDDGEWEDYMTMEGKTTPEFLIITEWLGNGENAFVDTIGEGTYIPEKVWVIGPASGTEITSLGTTFEFGWEGLDNWDTLLTVFQNRQTGIFSQAKIYEIETIGVS